LADWIPLAAAAIASVALVWFLSEQPVVTATFAAGTLVLGMLARLILARRPSQPTVEQAETPDWSVTVAAIDQPDVAVAIVDRAGRLVCANRTFETWFGVAFAPPRLPVDDPSLERLTRAARAASRDGKGDADLLTSPSGRWKAAVERCGRGDDFLVWRFTEIHSVNPVDDIAVFLAGKTGRSLDKAGLAAAVVNPDGTIIHASTGFASRATGDPLSEVAGQDFVSYLRQDQGDRFSWAREGRQGSALTIFFVPLADPDAALEPDPATTPALMILADSWVGLGRGAGEASSAVPHLEALLSQLPLGLAMADRDGRLLFANVAFMRAALREGEMPPTYPTDLVVQEDKGPLSDTIRRFAVGPVAAGDIAVRLTGQPDEPVSLSLAGVRGLGEAAVLLGLNDNSEETRLKRQVAQATKMQAVGQLAGGVAHDFNNVLTAILGTCDLMLMRHMPGDSDYDDIQQIRANSNRAASLTRQLLAFSRQQTLRPEVLQLPDVVSEVSQMLKRLIGEKIQFIVHHDRNLGSVRADPTQLEQVIVNLVVNARDAIHATTIHATGGKSGIENAGQLRISTRRVTPADVRAMRNEVMPQGDYTALIVEDDGGGIPPDILGKIWEPFFSTKEPGRGGTMGGTGLGLSTVYGIVKQSGGFIFADSELGKGTRFSVYLPVHDAALDDPANSETPEPRLPASSQQSEWAGGGHILLVEDEDPVRMVAERALSRAGYTVTSASDGEAGLEKVQEGGKFDLVLSDVVMPSMDGPAMAREIRKLVPEIPLIFMSGYAEEQLRKEIDIGNMHFLAKPFSVQQLSDKVGSVLGAARSKQAADFP
jgi:two-component system, cell cycle sensor histidine kinase and response regulator CckA